LGVLRLTDEGWIPETTGIQLVVLTKNKHMLQLQKQSMWSQVKQISLTTDLELKREAKKYLAILNTKDRYNYVKEIKSFIQKHSK
jgi:hypothetical protein